MKTIVILIGLNLILSCSGKYYRYSIKDKGALNRIKCVAILPVNNLTKSAEGPGVISDLLSSSLTNNSIFRLVPLSDVDKGLDIGNIGREINKNVLKGCEAGRSLNSDGVIAASLSEYAYQKRGPGYEEPKLGFSVTIYEVKECKPLWTVTVARNSTGVPGSTSESLSGLAMSSIDEITKNLMNEFDKTRILDFSYKCGPKRFEEVSKCGRGEGGFVDFEKCPEAIPYLRLGREKVSLEGDEIIFNDRISFIPGKALIDPSSHTLLKDLIKFLNKNNISRIRIESYILSGQKGGGSRQTDLDRAGEIRKFLMKNGILRTQVDVANFSIKPELVEGKEITNLRFVVFE